MLSKIDRGGKFLKETSKKYNEILEEFRNTIDNTSNVNHLWSVFPIYNILGVCENNVSKFNSISENINLATDYTIISIGISVVKPGNDPKPHFDKHPTDNGFMRYHLPLQLTSTSAIYVKDGSWSKYSWSLGEWMRFDGINHLHYPLNEDENGTSRIVLIMDIFEGDASDKDVYEYYEEIERLGVVFNDADFRPYYEEYIKNKTLL